MNLSGRLKVRPKRRQRFDAETIAAAVELYIEHCQRTPITVEKIFHNRGEIVRTKVKKHHTPSLAGLAVALGVSSMRLRAIQADRANQPELANAIDRAQDRIAAYLTGLAGADAVNTQIAGRALDHAGMPSRVEQLPPTAALDAVSRMTREELELLAASDRVNKHGK